MGVFFVWMGRMGSNREVTNPIYSLLVILSRTE